jgi:SAM-dependent methyltransferase
VTTGQQLPPREEVERFVNETTFSGYQRMPLPHGFAVPGRDMRPRIDEVLGSIDLQGRSLLDVGTNYGMFPWAAVERGASRAVGLEPNPQHFAVSRRIAELNGDRWEVRPNRVEELEPDEQFDVVLFLNVLHHVLDPVDAVRRLVAVCRGEMVIEFCLPDDSEYLVHLYDRSVEPSRWTWYRAKVLSHVIRPFTNHLPLMAVGNMPYDRTFYFSPRAFDHLFRVHLGWFDRIRFTPTITGQRRLVAHCSIAKD